MLISILGSGLQGCQQNLQRFAASAERISAWGDPEAETTPTADLVELLSARQGAEASLAVIAAGDRLLGSLIDILA